MFCQESNNVNFCNFSVWGTDVKGVDCGKEVNDWFREYLKADVVLIYFHPKHCHRPVEDIKGKEFTRKSRKVPKHAVVS